MKMRVASPTLLFQLALVVSRLSVAVCGEKKADEARREADRLRSIHFVAFGDWGAPLKSLKEDERKRKGQRAVADGVANWLNYAYGKEGDAPRNGDLGSEGPFILCLGDNFYPHGVKDAHHMAKRFQETFEEVYTHDEFDNVPWYVVAGNKDYEGKGDVTAQMNFPDDRWIFPDYFHRTVRKVDNLKVEVIMIDTMQLSGTIHFPRHKNGSGLDRTSFEIADRGFKYIEHHLQHSDADYLLVAGHYPPKSIPGFEELLQKYDVSAYVGGHIHCQQHKQIGKVHQFVSGAGMELNCKGHGDSVDKEDGTGGFLSFHAEREDMIVRFHDQDGNVIHRVTVLPRFNNGRAGEISQQAGAIA
ncbi:hypothetical protein ACHAWF_013041 [Thalassiosira exigua]